MKPKGFIQSHVSYEDPLTWEAGLICKQEKYVLNFFHKKCLRLIYFFNEAECDDVVSVSWSTCYSSLY